MRAGKIILAAAVSLAVLQLAAIGQRIWAYERIISEGKQFLFKTDVVDPYDLFRGRYVAISQENLRIKITEEEVGGYKSGEEFYGQLTVGEDGFASITSLSDDPTGGDELKVEVQWAGPKYELSGDKKVYYVNLKPPFDRYYIGESKAPAAEKAYREHAKGKAYLSVKILEGRGVLEELYIDGAPVKEWLKANSPSAS